MADSDKSQKTEAPTEKRKADSAKKGDVLQSRDLAAALVMLAGAGWLMLFGQAMVGSMGALVRDGLGFDHASLANFDPANAALRQIELIAVPLIGLLGFTLIAAVVAPALLGSLGWRNAAMAFKGSRIDPLAGIKRIFGMQGLAELGKAIAKVILLGAIGWWLLARQWDHAPGLARTDIKSAIGIIGWDFALAFLWLSVGLGLIAVIDVPSQYLLRISRMRMTKQEVRDEHKQSEGSPETKMAQRRRQHEVLHGSARRAVAEATVILTNPTHFAVALRYRPGLDAAPMVVARGADDIAQAIRTLAGDSDVPVLSYPELTRAIYFTSRTGHPIREDLYLAVATVIAFVFNLDAQLATRDAQPPVTIPPEARFDSEGRPAI